MDGRMITALLFLTCAILSGVYSVYCMAQEQRFRKNCTYTEGIVTGHEKVDSRIRLRINFMEDGQPVTVLTQPEHMKMMDMPEGTKVPVSYVKAPDPANPGQMKYEMYLEEKRVIQKSSKPHVVLAKTSAVFFILTILLFFYYLSR